MTQRRKAEASGVRPWDRGVAEANDLDTLRTWVVWGAGAPPERAAAPETQERPGEPGDDIAWKIAERFDKEWAEAREDRWVRVVESDEEEVDALVLDDDAVGGYAPYLHDPEAAAARPEFMRGVLRNDVIRRRRFDAGRPG